MAKQTLLAMTQEILESMQSDIVDAITDTGESTAVAHIIRRTYWDLFGPLDLPENYTLFRLTETSATTPTLMTVPTNVMKVEWVKYDTKLAVADPSRFRIIEGPIPIDIFFERTGLLFSDQDNVVSYSYSFPTGSAITIQGNDDQAPTYFSTPDDDTLLFNSYDSGIETFLKAAKTQAYGLVDPDFTYDGAWVPDLDARQFPLLFNSAKAMAFAEIKQTQHAKAESRERHLMVSAQRTKQKVGNADPLSRFPNFGRK